MPPGTALLAQIRFFTPQGLMVQGKVATGIRGIRRGKKKQMKSSCCSKSFALGSRLWQRRGKISSCTWLSQDSCPAVKSSAFLPFLPALSPSPKHSSLSKDAAGCLFG